MPQVVARAVVGLAMVGIFAVARPARAETFELLSFSVPPGWSQQAVEGGTSYRRIANGRVLATFTLHASTAASGTAEQEFGRAWTAWMGWVEGAPPTPRTLREGAYTIAAGTAEAPSPDGVQKVVLAVYVGNSRALAVTAIGIGPEGGRALDGLLATVKVAASPAAPPPAAPAAAASGSIGVEYDVPPGYRSRRDGQTIVIEPVKLSEAQSCMFVVMPTMTSSGDLVADADTVLAGIPGWQVRTSPRYWTMERGLGATGWSYVYRRTDLEQADGDRMKYLGGFAFVIESAPGLIDVVWGVGPLTGCPSTDPAVAKLRASLRPRAWKSDAYAQLKADLLGTWRFSTKAGIIQYTFLENGRFDYGGITETVRNAGSVDIETTRTLVGDGTWKIDGGDLVLSWDAKKKGRVRKPIRIYEASTSTITRPNLILGMAELGNWVEYYRVVY